MNWKFFVVGEAKSPLGNCPQCRDAGPEHNRESCLCLTCHGFYAATDDAARLLEMARRFPNHHWAVRTGAASGIAVLDAEGAPEGDLPSGVSVLDNWESWTNGLALPPTRLIAATPSGGVHRYYRYEPGLRSRNRILPGVDLKSDGGYVLVPSPIPQNGDPRRWVQRGVPGVLDEANLAWLRKTLSGGRSWGRSDPGVGVIGGTERPIGYDFERFRREGCPGGCRDEFFNELIFRLRKRGVDRALARQQVRDHWKKAAQPPDARWYMPFHHVEYKIARIWQTVEPDAVADELQSWATRATATGATQVRRPTRVTLVPRGDR